MIAVRHQIPVDAKASAVATLHDALRRDFNLGLVLLTPGVKALAEPRLTRLLALVASFEAFTPENDPWGEHDFGQVELDGEGFFWKIDPYDVALDGYSSNPADPSQTRRVLTVMRAEEY